MVADAYTEELLPQFTLFARDALGICALPRQARVLDVATGPGTLALMAAAEGVEVCAVDFSKAMLAALSARAAKEGHAVDARLADGQSLPFPDDQFDAAFSMFGLMFFPDRGAGFRELRRVLRPGGRSVVSSWAPFEGAFAAVFDALRAQMPGLPFGQGKGPLGDPAEFAQELTTAGFREVAVQPYAHEAVAPSAAELWATVQRSTALVVLLRRKLGEAAWAPVAAGVFERLKSALGDGPVTLALRAYLGTGVK